MLSSHAYYAFGIMLKILLVHRQNISFSMRVHALNGVPRVIITFSHGEGFEASLLFSWSKDFCLLFPYASQCQNYASIMCQGIVQGYIICSNRSEWFLEIQTYIMMHSAEFVV